MLINHSQEIDAKNREKWILWNRYNEILRTVKKYVNKK